MTPSPTPTCIHGFDPGQCAACATCPHGLTTSRCGRCAANAAAAARRAPAKTAPAIDTEEREGWEIFYVPQVSGWRIRKAETEPMPESYRSLFLARKAVDRMIASPPEVRASKRRR